MVDYFSYIFLERSKCWKEYLQFTLYDGHFRTSLGVVGWSEGAG